MAKTVTGNILIVIAPPHTLGAMVLVLAIRATNTLARVRATPVVWAPPEVASMRLVPAPAVMSGKMAVAKNKFSTVPKVICIIAMAKLLVYVLQVWASMSR